MSAPSKTDPALGAARGAPFRAGRVREAVDATERRICGESAVDSVSIAEGLAVAGRRAARLHGDPRDPGDRDATSEVPWVDHRVGVAAQASRGAHAFEIVASDAQEAVDHCLVAHRLAVYLGRSGLCTIDAALAESLAISRLADRSWIDTLPAVGDRREGGRLEVARAAFAETSVQTGRALDPGALVWLSGVETEDLREALGDARASVATRNVPASDPVALGCLPGGMFAEALLLDTVATLGPLGTPMLDAHRGVESIVTIGDGHRDDRPLDLLLALRPEALDGVAPLERLRECAMLLLRMGTEDPAIAWARLSPEQRATILRRRLRLGLVAPEIVDPAQLAGTLLAALPEIGRAFGADGDVGRRLAASAAATAEALRAGRSGLIVAEPARLGEPASSPEATTREPPVMPSVPGAPDAEREREALRSFHFGGGVDAAPIDPALAPPLRPAVLDALAPHAALGSESLLDRWAAVVLADRRRRRSELQAEVVALVDRLRATLGLSVGPTAGALAASLGQFGAEHMDPGALQDRVARSGGEADLPVERRQRLSRVLATLEQLLAGLGESPLAYVLRPAESDAASLPPGVTERIHPDGLRAAIGLFDGLADGAVTWASALRTARLEAAGDFDDAVHGPILARLDRHSLTDDELLRMPAVVVLETGRRLRGPALASLSDLIRSGRPVQVLVTESLAGLGTSPGYHPGVGYLAVAHREALVVQSSFACGEHLTGGIERARTSLNPVVILVAIPGENAPVPAAEQLEAAVQGRATPCFVYDPAGGTTWAERFALEANPQTERAWPVHQISYLDAEGGTHELEQLLTFAHAVALDPCWRSHFLVLQPDAWLDDQIEIARYLELGERERSRSVPYLWVAVGGRLARAVIRWELAFACRDRARAWRNLQELAGTDNAYARRAADEARAAAQHEADERASRMEADFAVALESARSGGADAAIHRLVHLLADPQGFEAATSAVTGVAVPDGIPLPAMVEATPPAATDSAPPAPAAAAPLGGPYIDSFLCTSCNDCIDLNSRLFRYNQDKQAEIADPAGGTFKQLVRAAEKCPARCIHPGSPRAGDTTATAALIARAEKFQ